VACLSCRQLMLKPAPLVNMSKATCSGIVDSARRRTQRHQGAGIWPIETRQAEDAGCEQQMSRLRRFAESDSGGDRCHLRNMKPKLPTEYRAGKMVPDTEKTRHSKCHCASGHERTDLTAADAGPELPEHGDIIWRAVAIRRKCFRHVAMRQSKRPRPRTGIRGTKEWR